MRNDLRLSQQSAIALPRVDPARARPGAGVLRPATSASRATTRRTSRGSSSASSRPRAAVTRRCATRSPSTSRAWPTRPGARCWCSSPTATTPRAEVPPQEVQRLRALERGDDLPRRVRGRRAAEQPRARCGPARSSTGSRRRPAARCSRPAASRQLAAIYQTILDELGSQYVLGYTSDNLAARRASSASITVELKRPELKVRHRPRLRRAEGPGAAPGEAAVSRSASRPARQRPIEQRLDLALQLAQPPLQLRQLREHRDRLEPGAVLDRRESPRRPRPPRASPGCPLWAVATTPSPISMWPATPTWPASVTRRPIRVLPATPTWPASTRVLADRDRVADLHQVVELGAAPDARLAERRAVDRGERADLDVVLDHHDPHLRELVVAALGVAREAEAVGPDHGAVLHHHAAAEPAALAHAARPSAARSPRRPATPS